MEAAYTVLKEKFQEELAGLEIPNADSTPDDALEKYIKEAAKFQSMVERLSKFALELKEKIAETNKVCGDIVNERLERCQKLQKLIIDNGKRHDEIVKPNELVDKSWASMVEKEDNKKTKVKAGETVKKPVVNGIMERPVVMKILTNTETRYLNIAGCNIAYKPIKKPADCLEHPGQFCGYENEGTIMLAFSVSGYVFSNICLRPVNPLGESPNKVLEFDFNRAKGADKKNYYTRDDELRNMPGMMTLVEAGYINQNSINGKKIHAIHLPIVGKTNTKADIDAIKHMEKQPGNQMDLSKDIVGTLIMGMILAQSKR